MSADLLLYKGAYGTSTRPMEGPLGLQYGQMRPTESALFHNAFWYNKKGQLLGVGDISSQDIKNIRRGLPEEEVFALLHEVDLASMSNWDREYPGRQFLVKHAKLIIGADVVYAVTHTTEQLHEAMRYGIRVDLITEKQAARLLGLPVRRTPGEVVGDTISLIKSVLS